jgi:predicted small lipoprotein YifL
MFVWCGGFGDFDVNRNDRPIYQGWALVLIGATALALGGCGRKGPLDLPPTASSQPGAAVQNDQASAGQASKQNLFNSGYGADAAPTAGKGPKRPFVLDPLLNSN